MTRRGGFTLIELMLTVAIIVILSVMVMQPLAHCIRAAIEARTKSHIVLVRLAIKEYAADNNGRYPTDHLGDLIDKGYLKDIPMLWEPPYHFPGNGVCIGPPNVDTLIKCSDGYVYDNDPYSPTWGTLVASCIHTDLKGKPWSSY